MLGKTGEKTQQVKVQRNTKEIIHHSASRELIVKIKCQTQHFQGFDFIMKCKVPVDILRLMAFQRFSKKFSIKLFVPINISMNENYWHMNKGSFECKKFQESGITLLCKN